MIKTTNQNLSYKCLNCASPLTYNSEENKLHCEYCDSTFSISEIKDAVDSSGDTGFQWGDYKKNVSNDIIENTVSYICEFCGAEIITDGVTAATKCPYCDNNVVISNKIEGLLKPNGIIPFKVDKDKLCSIVAGYCKGKKLLPKGFLNENKIREIQGLYVPFWLYDCHADGDMSFEGERVRHWEDSDYEYTEISHYLINCEGEMSFAKIPVDGSVKMADDLMDSIEPYDYNEIIPFEPGILSGFLADRFDVDADSSLPRATERVKKSVADLFQSTITGFSPVHPIASNIGLDSTGVNYVLLPVYIIKSKYKENEYTFAVNGQTGKITGNLPYSRGKFFAYLFGIAAGVTAVLGTVLQALLGGGLF